MQLSRLATLWSVIAVGGSMMSMCLVSAMVPGCSGVPLGVTEPTAFEYGEYGAPLRSPRGDWKLQVRFNDAGGMHSGNHWTWIIAKDRIGRRYVIAEGYSGPSVRYGREALPVRWFDDATFEIRFLDGRHSESYKTQRVKR